MTAKKHKQYTEAEFSFYASDIKDVHDDFTVQCISSSVESVRYCLMRAILGTRYYEMYIVLS